MIEFLILGAGAVVQEYYLPAFAALGRLSNLTVVDESPRAIAALRRHFPEVRYKCDAYDLVLSGSRATNLSSAVIVALPNALHVKASTLALEQGFHVLCEKPLALRFEDCGLLARAALDSRRVIKIAMSRRYLPALMAARELVRKGNLGGVIAVTITDRMAFRWRPRSYRFFEPAAGGILADLGVHYLDFLFHVFGNLEPLGYEDDARGGVESKFTYELRAGEIPIRMNLSRLEGHGDEIRIECESGIIRVKNEAHILVESNENDTRALRVSLSRPFSNDYWPIDYRGSFCEMLTDFEGALSGRPSRLADVHAAEVTTRLIDWAYHQRTSKQPHRRPAEKSAEVNWLVTGATGFVGGHLIDHLDSLNDCSIRVTARTPATCANIARYPVQITPTDLMVKEQVTRAVAGARIIVHLAWGDDGYQAFEATKNVVNASIACKAEAVVVLSTMYVYGFPNGVDTIDETFPYQPYGGEYGQSKAKMEQWCLRRAQNSGSTKLIILNPTCVFGSRGGPYTTLPVMLARQRQFCWVDGGVGLCNYTYVENLVDAIVLAAKTPNINGERFIINDGWVTWREFLEPMLGSFGANAPSFTSTELLGMSNREPQFSLIELARAIATCTQVREVLRRSSAVRAAYAVARRGSVGRFLERRAMISPVDRANWQKLPEEKMPPSWLPTLFPSNQVRFLADKASRHLGWRPQIPLDIALERTLCWLNDADLLTL